MTKVKEAGEKIRSKIMQGYIFARIQFWTYTTKNFPSSYNHTECSDISFDLCKYHVELAANIMSNQKMEKRIDNLAN